MTDSLPLVDKFIVVGVDTTKESITYNNVLEDEVHPTFLDIFPFEQQESPSYLDNFKMWCFPDGFSIYGENLKKINTKKRRQMPDLSVNGNNKNECENIFSKNSLHHFVLTNQNTEKKYCTGLLIHEEVYLDVHKPSHPSLKTISESSATGDNNIIKVFIPKMICVVSSRPVLEFQKQFLSFVYKFGITSKLSKQPPRLKVYSHLYDKFCDICEQEGDFQSAEKKWLDEVYNQTIAFIKQLESNDPLAEQFMLKEDYLINFAVSMVFRAHILPAQIKDGFKKELLLTLSNEEVCRLRPSRNQQFFQMANFSFRPLFERISISTLINLLSSILLERQIIIVAQNPNEIISICEAIFTLIYPLKWVCLYIPLLPLELSEMLSALMPYIVGISKQSFFHLQNKIDLKDKVLIDLDDDTVSSNETLRLPEYLIKYLQGNLKDLSKQFVQSDQQSSKKEIWIQTVFRLKRVFFNFITCLLNNFSPFLLYSNEIDKNSVASRDVFSVQEYIDIFDHEQRPFMTELANNTMVLLKSLIQFSSFFTQKMFNKFIEESYKILFQTEFMKQEFPSEDKENLFFYLRCLKKIQKSMPKTSAESKFDTIYNPLLFSALDIELQSLQDQSIIECSQSITIDLTQHLIKYLRLIEKKAPETLPTYSAGSAKYLTVQRIIFMKLNKDWLMPVPPIAPQIQFPSQDENINNQISNEVALNHSIQNQSEYNDSVSSKSLQNSNQIYKNQRQGGNKKDQYCVDEESDEPSVSSHPILFFRNMFMEYDSYSQRCFKQEFDSLILQFPQKQQSKNYNLTKQPATKPIAKDPLKIVFMQEQLQALLQAEEQKQEKNNRLLKKIDQNKFNNTIKDCAQKKNNKTTKGIFNNEQREFRLFNPHEKDNSFPINNLSELISLNDETISIRPLAAPNKKNGNTSIQNNKNNESLNNLSYLTMNHNKESYNSSFLSTTNNLKLQNTLEEAQDMSKQDQKENQVINQTSYEYSTSQKTKEQIKQRNKSLDFFKPPNNNVSYSIGNSSQQDLDSKSFNPQRSIENFLKNQNKSDSNFFKKQADNKQIESLGQGKPPSSKQILQNNKPVNKKKPIFS